MTGTELRARRDALGLSQEALARALGPLLGRPLLAGNTIARWESGRLGIAYPGAIEAALRTLERQHTQREEY